MEISNFPFLTFPFVQFGALERQPVRIGQENNGIVCLEIPIGMVQCGVILSNGIVTLKMEQKQWNCDA